MSSNNNKTKPTSNATVLKSGVWYTAANFLMKSIGLITTPVFTRLLSHADYGSYSNYSSWLSIIIVLATFNLVATFLSARFDFEEDFDGYVSSSLVLSSIITMIWAAIIWAFFDFVASFTSIDKRYLYVMIVYLIFYAAVDMFQARERYYYRYKTSVVTSLLIAVSSALLSVLLVLKMENRLTGRILGSAVPTILVGNVLYVIIILRGRKVRVAYWKYALPICIPYIPHILSMYMLNSMDKMMITKLCSPEQNALYSVAYSCGAVITLFINSLNTAFQPWLAERLNDRRHDEIRKASKGYILVFVYAACGVMLITPEILMVMGGAGYSEAIYVMPPVTFGCACQFLYTMYVNIEQFHKKTVGMALASAAAALSNYILNRIFIPRFGYIAAAYTTLASFAILLFIHMFLVKRMGLHKVYSTKLIFLVLGFLCVYTVMVNFLFANNVVRYVVIGVYAVMTLVIIAGHGSEIIKIVKQRN